MLKEVRRRFGKHVAGVVDGCTEPDITPQPSWRRRKQHYVRVPTMATARASSGGRVPRT